MLIDLHPKFKQQAAAAVAKATQLLGVIRHSFPLLDKHMLLILYKSLVRPHLKFGNLVWGPFHRADHKKLERVGIGTEKGNLSSDKAPSPDSTPPPD